MVTGLQDRRNLLTARVFFDATTRPSTNSEDILPQEGGHDADHSVFSVFAQLFPEIVGASSAGAHNRRMRLHRLHFNKIGYTIYLKEQSRRVPNNKGKQGRPGYGFRLARWRNTVDDDQDRNHCETMLRSISCDELLIDRIKRVVQDYHNLWEKVRRSSRPAGPGRPRRLNSDAPAYTQKYARAGHALLASTISACPHDLWAVDAGAVGVRAQAAKVLQALKRNKDPRPQTTTIHLCFKSKHIATLTHPVSTTGTFASLPEEPP